VKKSPLVDNLATRLPLLSDRRERGLRLDFAAENFLLSFSQPNFYFHAATSYDILRWNGVRIGKRDFTDRLRTKPIAARA